ncbi:hypothetical protein PSMK_29400 [Phycisphaera mikurensis NBRC 102666]|uniref:Uncharacterized protein n=1 Tax=Phycisphaera mikurensis (strain NBRC 102666 / KCTC 22515 / FYK2301M01) TaxID=1142394 RepID=I0IIL1_PHYMF|nr:hypothetical protein PSMK_29400 [Phycisphaera mikurensis NBRC 102666]
MQIPRTTSPEARNGRRSAAGLRWVKTSRPHAGAGGRSRGEGLPGVGASLWLRLAPCPPRGARLDRAGRQAPRRQVR